MEVDLSYYELEYLLGLLRREELGNGRWDPDTETRRRLIKKLSAARRLIRNDPN